MDGIEPSGYDGNDRAADACYVDKHATRTDKVVVTRRQPPVAAGGQDLRPGFGL